VITALILRLQMEGTFSGRDYTSGTRRQGEMFQLQDEVGTHDSSS